MLCGMAGVERLSVLTHAKISCGRESVHAIYIEIQWRYTNYQIMTAGILAKSLVSVKLDGISCKYARTKLTLFVAE